MIEFNTTTNFNLNLGKTPGQIKHSQISVLDKNKKTTADRTNESHRFINVGVINYGNKLSINQGIDSASRRIKKSFRNRNRFRFRIYIS